jgi:hypothetical protein
VRKSKRLIAILATVALIVTMLVPMVTPAAAATTMSVNKILTIKAGTTVQQTSWTYTLTGSDANSLGEGDVVYLSLPTDYTIKGTFEVPKNPDKENTIGQIKVSVGAGAPITVNKNAGASAELTATNQNIKIEVTAKDPSGKPYIYFNITELTVPSGESGDVKLTAEAQSGSGFSSGDTVLATIGAGKVTLALDRAVLVTPDGGTIGKITVKETLAGDLDLGDSIKFKLPNGFTWGSMGDPSVKWGSGLAFDAAKEDEGRTLILQVTTKSSSATCLEFPNVQIKVDESVAKEGDIELTIGGESDCGMSSIVIGTFGSYAVAVAKVESKDIQPGLRDQKIGKFAIDEKVPGTLVKDRSITITLPDNCKWDGEFPRISDSDSTLQSFSLGAFAPIGTDNRTIKAKVLGASGGVKASHIVFTGGKITVRSDVTGDIALKVGGSAGVEGDVVVGNAKAPLTLTADSTPDVKIGLPAQAAGTMKITEVAAETLESSDFYNKKDDKQATSVNAYLTLRVPQGVTFSKIPTVTVSNGDLTIGSATKENDDRDIKFRVKSTSGKASTITISDISLTVDRTVPEGDLAIKVLGNSVIQNNSDGFFPSVTSIGSAVIAKCVTPAPGEEKATVVFKINDTNFTVNGAAYTMDVAPYIKDSRTFLPVRYVAQSCGVSASNILFSNGKVTLIKGDKVIQLTIGSKTMLVNGIAVDMDAAAEISNGRTMLPFSWIAKALGASVSFDGTAQTVTMTI